MVEKIQVDDAEEINNIMTDVWGNMDNQDYYVVCSKESIIRSITDNPYSIKLIDQGKIIAFFIVRTREDEKDICDYLKFDDEKKKQSIIMGNTIVKVDYRGQHLQSKMIKYIEKEIIKNGQYKFAVCTIYPENNYSIDNFLKNGYVIAKEINKTFSDKEYEGNKDILKRFVLLKNL